jgi:adenylylsulfate kinase-like enzyme
MTSPGTVIWVTGLSGSGKTTFTKKLNTSLQNKNLPTIFLDGDDIRMILNAEHSQFSREERLKLGFVYSRLCEYLSRQGFVVIIGTIALFKEIHEWNRTNFPNYIEILMDPPVEEIRKRNSKSIYSKFNSGQLVDVSGLDILVDIPVNPDFRISDSNYNINDIADNIETYLRKK